MKLLDYLRITLMFSTTLAILLTGDDVIREDGDVMLASIFDVSEGNSDGTCGAFDLAGVRSAYAVQWFVRQLNQRNYIPGVKIGLESRRTCYSHVRTMQAVFDLIDTYITNSSERVPLAGILGPSRTDPATSMSQMLSSLPENQRTPQISGSATGIALSNKKVHKNFYRVIPPDGAQVEVIRELLTRLRWNYIAIIYTDEEYGRSAAAALLKEVGQHSICVPVYASIPTDTSSLEFNTAVEDIVETMNGNAKAGVSSPVLGAVFIGGRMTAQQFVIKLDNRANFVEIIFSEALGLDIAALKNNKNAYTDIAKGALTVTPQYREVKEFRQAWNNLWGNCSNISREVMDDVWLKGLKDQVSDCSQLQLGQREKMLYTWYYLKAAAMFAAALKSVHSQACSNVVGPCSTFLSHVQKYEHVKNTWRTGLDLEAEFGDTVASFKGMTNVSFDDAGEVVTNSPNPLYEVYNFRPCLEDNNEFCFVKVGNNTMGAVSLDEDLMMGHDSGGQSKPWQELDKAQCSVGKDCLECVSKTSDSALVIPGDFYFVALAPVHTRDPDDALECGKARPSLGADFVQAIEFALKEVNKEGGRWTAEMPGRKLGAIIFDSCYSPLVVKNKLLQLHKGYLMTPEGPLDEDHVKNVLLKRIAGYIGGFFSVISFAMSDILTKLDRKAYVHLSPTSVAPGLSDREQHPYFMRLTVSANSEILAMMDILRTLSATFIQIIYDPVDDYSADLTEELENKAAQHGVCVAQKIEAPLRSDPNLYARILQQLRQKSSARMVIVILQYEQILQVMNYLIGSGSQLKEEDNFVFLGSEAWARRPQIIQGKQRLAGSITVAEEIAVDPLFTNYFKTVDVLNTTNFWLKDYLEARGNCYYDLGFRRKDKTKMCDSEIQRAYVQDPWVSYYIQAVYAFASGVGKALRYTCHREEETICSSLTASVMVNYMKQVKLDLFSQGSQRRVFDSNGDGENGYKFMQAYWDPNESAMKYRQIGTWTVGGRLSLSVPVSDLVTKLPFDLQPKNYNSSCSSEVECQICPSSKPAEAKKDAPKTMQLITAVVVIGVLALLLVILIVVVIVLVRRVKRLRSSKQEQYFPSSLKFENDGMSTLSSFSNQPVQEMQERGDVSPAREFSGAPSGEYDMLNAATTNFTFGSQVPEHPPKPCTLPKQKPDYLRVIAH